VGRRIRWSLLIGAVLATLAITPSQASSGPAAASSAKKDWSTEVDFPNTLNKFDPADAALVKMLEPHRIKNPGERARYQRQLDALVGAQRTAKARGASKTRILGIASPELVAETIDPGCQLTSSNPGGYDLCAYDADGDTMSLWDSGRGHKMWAGIQEKDTGGDSGLGEWRVWAKSQAYGLTSNNVAHYLDLSQLKAWMESYGGGIDFEEGYVNPAAVSCSSSCPIYITGVWRSQAYWQAYGTSFVRGFVRITGTNDTSDNTNGWCSGWWGRQSSINGASYWPGPEAAIWGCNTP
jgi:hypothetical protein